MDKLYLLQQLKQVTGSLEADSKHQAEAIKTLERKLTEQLVQNPAFTITGTNLHHVATQAVQLESTDRLDHIDDLFEEAATKNVAPALVFRRETSLRSNLLGNSVADWASGMAASETLGPFIDKHGSEFYFDFFFAIHTVQVFISGVPYPVLLVPIRGFLTERKSYTITAGSVWIASNFITRNAAQAGYYTGLKIKGGTLNFALDASVADSKLFSALSTKVVLHLDLDQNAVSNSPAEAGMDAAEAKVQLPQTLDFEYTLSNSKLTAGDASCVTFGCETTLSFHGGIPQWQPLLQQIIVPYVVRSSGQEPDKFFIHTSQSALATISSSATISANSGWLLPAAKIDPAQLGNAAGTGAICINLKPGLKASWKGLKGGACLLNNAFIIAEPGMLSVIDFTADNMYGKQRWKLWENKNPGVQSEIKMSLAASFPFVFISNSNGTEIVSFLCNFKAELDRPVASDGAPFKIASPVALTMISQKGNVFKALLLDTNLWFDVKPDGTTATNPEGYKKYSIALRNMLFNTTSPYSFFIQGTLEGDEQLTNGLVTTKFGISLLLPTLPDPYVSNYKPGLRQQRGTFSSDNINLALAAFIKWAEPEAATLYFHFADYDHPYLPPAPPENQQTPGVVVLAGGNVQAKNFRSAGTSFGASVIAPENFAASSYKLSDIGQAYTAATSPSSKQNLRELITTKLATGEFNSYIYAVDQDKTVTKAPPDFGASIKNAFDAALQVLDRPLETARFASVFVPDNIPPDDAVLGSIAEADFFTLLDVSTHADQMGVSFGNPIGVQRDANGEYNLRSAYLAPPSTIEANVPFGIDNLDVVSTGTRLRAVTLPQISWEPVLNTALEKAAPPGFEAIAKLLKDTIQFISDTAIASLPANVWAGYESIIDTIVNGYITILNTQTDTITVLPGLMVYDNDGIPTKFSSESPYLVPIAPLPVTTHFLKEYHDKTVPRNLHASFTLPFGMLAKADFARDEASDKNGTSSKLTFHRPWFNEFHGGLQVKAIAGKKTPTGPGTFNGWAIQLNDNIKWFLFGIPATGSTLGEAVRKIYNNEFQQGQPTAKVPLEKIEFSGYGASMFSNWIDSSAAIAAVSQAKFDVLMGRTAHEVVQVRSVMYMATGCVHVVRTITLMRSPNGYVYRSDSGWKAESDAFYDCDYKVKFEDGSSISVTEPYEFHPGAVLGVSNVREIKDYPAGGVPPMTFTLKDTGLPSTPADMVKWKTLLPINSPDDPIKVELQAVAFDADVHIENVKSGGTKDTQKGGFRVMTKKMLGYVQLAPTGIMIAPKTLAQLLIFQNGSLGGPVDSIIDIAGNDQRMRLARVDINPAKNIAGNYVFATAARGSLILPKDGSWSVVKHIRNTGDVKPVEEGQLVPLIKPNEKKVSFPGSDRYRIADPADIIKPEADGHNYGVLQSTGTQKLLFNIPQFLPPALNAGKKQLLSDNTYFADAYKLLNAKGVFPNVANALGLTAAQKSVDIFGEGLMKLLDAANKPFEIPMGSLLPANYEYEFINEPDIVRIYAQYKNANGGGNLSLGINSAAALADTWKAAMGNVTVCIDLGSDPLFKKILYVEGDFNAASGSDSKYGGPKLQFGAALKPMVDILAVLATLTGNSFDDGMEVGMSNSPDNWEYKFNTSKEIPVIKFPTPEPPNTPMKLEAGLKVGFYFNEVLNVSKDLSSNLPLCGAYIEFYARLEVMCFSVSLASVYAVGQANLGISADTGGNLTVYMKFGFGVELVVGYPVVGNAHVLFMASVGMSLGTKALDVIAGLLFKGSVEICGGLVTVCIQIEAQGIIHKELTDGGNCYCTVQVSFSIDVCVLWVIDIDYHDDWSESRQIA
ncbi:MAG: hypothetical protein ABI594_03075 [Ginsengibacter sp.]